MRKPMRPGLGLAVVMLLALAACGDSGGEEPADPSAPTPTEAEAEEPTAPDTEPESAQTDDGDEPEGVPELGEGEAQDAAADEEVLILRYWQSASVPLPHLSNADKDEDAAALTLEPLASYDPEGNLVPKLAAEIPTPENGGVSPDLMTITWRLKDGLRWSDGRAMTADDVAFTWRYCTEGETTCADLGIASVEAADERTVVVTFNGPTTNPYTAFVGSGMPIISEAQFAECVGAAIRACEEQNTSPLGTGPYRFVEFTANEGAEYERNPFYHGIEPYFDRVVLVGGGDAVSAARSVLETGEADYAWNLQVEPDILREMLANERGWVVSAFASLVERIFVNQTNPDPALGDDRSEYMAGSNPHPFFVFTPIPQAMSMAIDRVALADLYGFAGEPTCNLVVAPSRYVSTANDACLSQDIEGANQLLDASGVLDGDGDGIREYQGVPLRITYQTSTNAIRQQTQELIQDWWRQIGIETELLDLDAGEFFGGDPDVVEQGTYKRFFSDVLMFTEASGIDPQQFLSSGLCSSIPVRDNHWSTENVPRACNSEYDELYAQLTQTPIGPERDRLVKQLNDITVQNYHQIPLVNRGLVSAFSNTLQHVWANAWDTSMWNIADWHR